MDLRDLLLASRQPTVIGVDDGPATDGTAPLAGVVCIGDRMEGLVWTEVTRDGRDATGRLLAAIEGKFRPQLHAVLTDGISVAGLNLLDLHALHDALGIPCIAVLRRPPDLAAFRRALRAAGLADQLPLVDRAGPVHSLGAASFQVVGAAPETAGLLLDRLTRKGRVPEPLRLAHLIAGAVVGGTSGRRA